MNKKILVLGIIILAIGIILMAFPYMELHSTSTTSLGHTSNGESGEHIYVKNNVLAIPDDIPAGTSVIISWWSNFKITVQLTQLADVIKWEAEGKEGSMLFEAMGSGKSSQFKWTSREGEYILVARFEEEFSEALDYEIKIESASSMLKIPGIAVAAIGGFSSIFGLLASSDEMTEKIKGKEVTSLDSSDTTGQVSDNEEKARKKPEIVGPSYNATKPARHQEPARKAPFTRVRQPQNRQQYPSGNLQSEEKTVYIYRGHRVEAYNIEASTHEIEPEEPRMTEVNIIKLNCSRCGSLFFVQNKLPPFLTLCPYCNNEEEVT